MSQTSLWSIKTQEEEIDCPLSQSSKTEYNNHVIADVQIEDSYIKDDDDDKPLNN